jgi:virginiamycin A acetyltransferase
MRYPIELAWRKTFEEFCELHKLYLAHPKRIANVYEMGQPVAIRGPMLIESYGTLVKNAFFSVGAYSFAQNYLPPGITIGRYCSIASGFEVMAAQHPMGRFTTSPVTYLPRWNDHAQIEFGKTWKTVPFAENLPPPIIQNDVWIGQQVLIKGGLTIGDGSCIAARSVVTKDVPPYAIVGGVPARIIRYRFSERQIGRLLAARWWRYNYADLPLDHWDDLDAFLDALQNSVEMGKIQPWSSGFWDLGVEFKRLSDLEG